MDGTILGQGSFTAVAVTAGGNTLVNPVVIAIPSGADFMWVKNFTRAGVNGNTATGIGSAATLFGQNYYWQRGMAAGTGVVTYKTSGASTLNEDTLNSGGFTLYDPSGQTAGALPLTNAAIATTQSSDATRPIVLTTNTAGIVVGSIVRLSGTVTPQLDVYGQDFVVGAVTPNVSFTLLTTASAFANAPGVTGGAGFWRLVNFDPLFYPRRRIVTNITQATQAVVSTNVPHGFTPGQEVRFTIPQAAGMTQLNSWNSGVNNVVAVTIASVSATDLNVFTINLDTTAYTAFTYPTSVQVGANNGSSLPEVAPVGEDTGFALTSPTIQIPGVASATLGAQIYNTNTGILADSTVNTGFLGMVLGGGGVAKALTTPIYGPAGSVNGDVVYWVAGKSTYGGL